MSIIKILIFSQKLLYKAWKVYWEKKMKHANIFPIVYDDDNDETEKNQREQGWGLSALELLSNYHQMEDPG